MPSSRKYRLLANMSNQVRANVEYVNEFMQIGISQKKAEEALVRFGNNKERALDYCLTNSEPEADPELQAVLLASKASPLPEDDDLKRAIEMSIKDNPVALGSFEPLNPNERMRVEGIPAGLKNVGNTCYFNSLLQTYFRIPKFVEAVLKFNPAVAMVKSE